MTGFDAAGQAETLSQGVPTAGRIPNGAIVEHELPGSPDELRSMLELKNPDYATAVRIVDAINAYSRERFRASAAYEVDSRRVELFRPRQDLVRPVHGRDRRTAGRPRHGRARRSRRAHRHGRYRPGRADFDGRGNVRNADGSGHRAAARLAAGPFSNGKTVVTPDTQIDVEQGGGPVAILGGSSLRALVAGLNRIGVKPPGIIAILQAIKTAGALQADLVIQ